ncbi:MAG: DsbA family protein [Actinobacteria bacterium]|nr:DsbA family protein [Actinomycetota bacterium]
MTVVEVFADITCPFAHAGLHRWCDARDRSGRSDIALKVRAWPLEIINGQALEGASVAHKVELLAEVFPALFVGFAPDAFPATTLPALALTNAAYRADIATGERVALALRDAVFIEGRDVADAQVLADVALAHGLGGYESVDERAVLADLEEGRSRGVVGSPHYFVGAAATFCPGLEIEHRHEDLDIHLAGERFREFLDACFAAPA